MLAVMQFISEYRVVILTLLAFIGFVVVSGMVLDLLFGGVKELKE